MSTDSFLRLRAVQDITGLSRAWIYAQASAGAFPKPIKIGSRASAWIKSEIDDWIAAQIAASRSEGSRL